MRIAGSVARQYPDWFTSAMAASPVMAVFRGLSPADTVRLADLAWDIGVTQVEVPIESSESMPSLKAAVAAGAARGMRVGAGTIVTANQLHSAIDARAAYAVSPGLDPDLIALADHADLPFLPGVATATEILQALNLGFSWLKAFPASVLGSEWFAAMKGPFPFVRLVATGGLDGNNASEFLDAGADVVGVGAAFGDARQREKLAQIIARHSI